MTDRLHARAARALASAAFAAALALTALPSLTSPALADDAAPTGKWRTFDPDTGAPKTVVEITEADGTLTGTIVELPQIHPTSHDHQS